MREQQKKNRRRLHIVPLIVGGYGTILGMGLTVLGLAEVKEGIGIIRFLLGLGMAGFGLYGVWDGVRDLVKPKKKPEMIFEGRFILTDIEGNRSSNVTIEYLQAQLKLLGETGKETGQSFHLQLLWPFSVQEWGMLKQISCIYLEQIVLTAIFEGKDGGYRTYGISLEPDAAEEWLCSFLAGNPDFAGWEVDEAYAEQHEAENRRKGSKAPKAKPEEADTSGSRPKEGAWAVRHRLLVIFGESWHDEHKFFSARDLELAVDGVCNGKYQKAVLEWGAEAFDLFPGSRNKLTVVWRRCSREDEGIKFYAKEGTAVQVKFWLKRYMNEDVLEDMNGWTDITAQVGQEWKKAEKNAPRTGRRQ